MLGGGRIRDALVEVLGTDVGGVTLDGAVRFVAADCGGDNGGEPLVTLDGQKQPGMTADDGTIAWPSPCAPAAPERHG